MRRAPLIAPRPRRTSREPVVPMINVVFLLLIFFLCTATFQRPESELAASLLVESPQRAGLGDAANDSLPLDSVSIVGSRRGGVTVWSVNDGPSTDDLQTLSALVAEVAAIATELPVTIDAGPDVTLGEIVAVYDTARSAGFVSVQLVADANRSAEQ